LAQDFWSHDRNGREQPEQAELCDPAETEAGLVADIGKPACGYGVMNVTLISKGNPDIHIREME
jgi:hypothetical protein